jgi:hypothetical protein
MACTQDTTRALVDEQDNRSALFGATASANADTHTTAPIRVALTGSNTTEFTNTDTGSSFSV